jgi:peptide chain release factor
MWLQISSGRGPAECELAVKLFLDMVLKECKDNKIKTNIGVCEIILFQLCLYITK